MKQVTNPVLGRLGAGLVGQSGGARLWYRQVIYKPGTGTGEKDALSPGNVGWHQDYIYWHVPRRHLGHRLDRAAGYGPNERLHVGRARLAQVGSARRQRRVLQPRPRKRSRPESPRNRAARGRKSRHVEGRSSELSPCADDTRLRSELCRAAPPVRRRPSDAGRHKHTRSTVVITSITFGCLGPRPAGRTTVRQFVFPPALCR